jgi:hypothetical protein
LDIDGFISPGTASAPFGGLSFGDLTLRGTYTADIGGSGNHDLLSIMGDLDLSSASDSLNIQVADFVEGEYVLATYTGSLTGQFNNVSLPENYRIDYGSGTNSAIKLVPEPSAIALILSGGLFALGRRRR